MTGSLPRSGLPISGAMTHIASDRVRLRIALRCCVGSVKSSLSSLSSPRTPLYAVAGAG